MPEDLAAKGLGGHWQAAHVEMALFMAGLRRDRAQLGHPVARPSCATAWSIHANSSKERYQDGDPGSPRIAFFSQII